MKVAPLKLIEAVRASYWFVPSLMAAAATLLGIVTVWLDSGPAEGLLSGIGWYQSVKPDGAHEVLSTIAGSMITVAGVVFSITIVAIAYAASQHGPRILTNFMADRGNQVTLGTFIATFVYCLVVLRTIRGGDEEFVPQLSVMIGLLFALCSIGVLIYFIHHVPQSIHVNHVLAQIGRQLLAGVDRRFPAYIGDPPDSDRQVRDSSNEAVAALGDNDGGTAPVAAIETGYIQAIGNEALLAAARKHDIVVRLNYRPGDYVHCGRALAEVWPAERLTDRAADRLRDCHAIGAKRTSFGDLNFLIDELVEIAARALSTGVNDPFTAIACIDWAGAALSDLAKREMPAPERVDEDGTVRVLALPDSFEDFVERALGRMRPYVGRDMNTAVHALRTIGEVAAACSRPDRIGALRAEARRLAETAEQALDGPELAEVRERARELHELLDRDPAERHPGWLAGVPLR